MSHQGVLSTKQQEAAFLKILKKQCNLICADCSSKSPTWTSLDFGVFVCYNCSGQHRALGQNITRVRSTKLDCWTQENVDMMDALGNDQNEYWESRLQKNNKIQPSATPEEIKYFVQEKYVKRTWVKQGLADPKTRYTQCLMSGVPFRVSKTNTFFSENGSQGQQVKDDMKQFLSTQQQGIQRNNRQFSIDSRQTQKDANLISPDKGTQFDWNSFNHFSTVSGVPNNQSQQTNQFSIFPKKQQLNEDQSPTFKPKNSNLNEFDLLTHSTLADNSQFTAHNKAHQPALQQQTHQHFNSHNPQSNSVNQQSWEQAQKQAQVQQQQPANQQMNYQCQQNQVINPTNNGFGSNNQQQGWGSQPTQQTQQVQQQSPLQYNQASSKPPLPGKQNVQTNYQTTNFAYQQQPQMQQQVPNQINYQTNQQQPQVQQQQFANKQQSGNSQQYQQYQNTNQNYQNNKQNFGFDNQNNNVANNNQQIYQDFNNFSFQTNQGSQNNNNTNNTNFYNNQQFNSFDATNQFQNQKYQNNPFAKDVQDIRNLYNTQQPSKYDQLRNNPFV
ncbi:unnamed protein product (macronuclear) [Paramecium tetraurelia]|uniref:Arf-GAP domain-containing protein n=1 Tax=Paramecium tetraurelia TaxID=5888 RepID=A0BS24_PARTE|nr:uncharacterized protein GSPATT00031572001 [Paramecium tetraurelia]CAK61341.1 unnamed protein product [Paramecium tetraurelia]|eukprot:XP_001428739.1 hypothetical protein (macronuclear) [Paramecium tetraurelia strain d4-2]